MRWFKFYKQDYLTDTKLIGIDPLLRHIWVTLLCLTDDNGEIGYLKERDLIRMAGIEDNDQINDLTDYDRVEGCLKFFEERGMIALQTVTDSNADRNATVTHHITVCKYLARQEENMSNAERQKRYRERHNKLNNQAKTNVTKRNNSNVTQRNDSNARIDKNRIDKNREDIKKEIIKKESPPTSLEVKESSSRRVSLDEITIQDLDEISQLYKVPRAFVDSKLDDLNNYCARSGKRYKDYKAALRDFVKKDAIKIRKEGNDKHRLVLINPK